MNDHVPYIVHIAIMNDHVPYIVHIAIAFLTLRIYMCIP